MADNPKQPYGDVPYADPGYQSDGKKRYPLDTEEHVRAAWSYINQADNAAKYSSDQVANIKGKIKAAASKFNIQIEDEQEEQKSNSARTPADVLVRGVFPMEVRDSVGDGMPTLFGYFAVFDQPARIDSAAEGQFIETVAPGAFRHTISDNRHRMRSLFNHGLDPSIGKKVVGPIAEVREDNHGGYYEVPMLDTSYNHDLLPGLREGLYGSSFQFTVIREAPVNYRPKRSDYNPDGWPEKRILEARVFEFGPCTFPAYQGATAEVRSLTDDFMIMRLAGDPERLQHLLQEYGLSSRNERDDAESVIADALSEPGAEVAHSEVREPQLSRWPSVSREEFLRIGKSEPGRFSFGR